MSPDILHTADAVVRRYEEELLRVLGVAEPDSIGGPASGGGIHEPIQVAVSPADYQLKEKQEGEKEKQEERAREQQTKSEERAIREEEKREREQERQRQEREGREQRANEEAANAAAARAAPAPSQSSGPPEVIGSKPQPITRGTSSRTSGGTGRR